MYDDSYILEHWQDYDRPMTLEFTGGETAELFTRQIADSFSGVLRYNFLYDQENIGFVTASIGGRIFSDTLWPRDAGVFLRELVCWGYLGRACLMAHRLTLLCGVNDIGFCSYPEKMWPGKVEAGYELDGTAAILVGFGMLCRKLQLLGDEPACAFAERMIKDQEKPNSSLRYLLHCIDQNGLISGSGEFGGGLGVAGRFYNVVANALCRNALIVWARLLKMQPQSSRQELGILCEQCAKSFEEGVTRSFLNPEGFWFCLDSNSLKPDPVVLNLRGNQGFSGVNGVLSMACDSDGLDLCNWPWREPARRTFFHLLEQPYRKKQYDRYGIYVQFQQVAQGLLSSPSYGQGYALQAALLMGEKEIAGNLLRYLVSATHLPPKEYILTRGDGEENWFYERLLLPEYFTLPLEKQDVDGEGCGALNLVNVAEPLKAARLMAGVAGTGEALSLHPCLPAGITGCFIRNLGELSGNTFQYRDLHIQEE